MSLLATSLLLASFVATRATLAPEDIPASCNALIDSTGKSAVTYLANVAAKLDDDKCKQSCVSSICGASIVDAAPRFMATSTKLVTAKKAAKGTTGLRSKVGVSKSTVHAVLMGLAVPERSPGCKNKCSGHGSCLQDCRNKDGSECLQECKTYDSDLLCVCNKRCVCNADWAGEDCSQPLKCEGCNLKHGQCTNGKCLCDSGYEGTDCGARIACPKGPGGFECGGDSRGLCDYGECTCKVGYEGINCSEKTPCPEDCTKNGFCVRGECQCFKGWSGEACATFTSGKPCSDKAEDAKDACSGHGLCFNGQCVCHPSYKGKDCQLMKQCPRGGRDGPKGMRNKQCSDKGECFMGKCICKPGYTGENCGTELPCDCSGHGVCHGGACVCNPGFKGTNCATAEYCPGKTLTSPQGCSDNGVCNDGACFCFDGYAGDSCAFNIQDGKERDRLKNCINPDVPSDGAKSCSGHGVCGYDKLNKPKNQGGQEFGTCLCVPGFGGEYCEEEKKCPKDCNGHGSCHGGVCTCRYGYRGDGCQTLDLGIDLCPNNCGDHGTCMLEECFCEPGFIGPACNVTVPCPGINDRNQPCNGHGTCSRGQCSCAPGYEGDGCGTVSTCPHSCSNHGVCYLGKCLCEPSYAGDACEFSPGCGDKVCENNGFCRQGACLCPSGYTGDLCERLVPGQATSSGAAKKKCPVDESGIECGGHGTCAEGSEKCKCETNWSGETCNVPSMDDVIGTEKQELDVSEEEGSAVELMKEMEGSSASANKKADTLLEVKETKEIPDAAGAPCKELLIKCDEQKCQQAGGMCYAGVGCVCSSSSGVSDVCVKGLSLTTSSTASSTITTTSLAANLAAQSLPKHKETTTPSSSWGVLSIIGMSVTGCLATVGLVAMIMLVFHHKKSRQQSSNNHQLDSQHQTSLLIEQRVLEQQQINLHLKNTKVEESVATGFVSRR